MAEFTFLRISWTVNDDSENKEEDTNGGHVHLPEMTVEITILHLGISENVTNTGTSIIQDLFLWLKRQRAKDSQVKFPLQ